MARAKKLWSFCPWDHPELLLLDKLFHLPPLIFSPDFIFFFFMTAKTLLWKLITFQGTFQLVESFPWKLLGFRFDPLRVKVNFDATEAIFVVPPFSAQNVNYEARKPLCWPKIPHRGIFLLSQKRPQNKGVKKNKRKANKTNHYFFLVWASILQVPNIQCLKITEKYHLTLRAKRATSFEYVLYLAHVSYHNAYNLLLFYREIEIRSS